MSRFPVRLLLAGSLVLTAAMPVLALPPQESTPLNSGWTAGANRIAPSYLDRSGEAEVSLRQAFDQFATMQGPSTTLGLQVRLGDRLVAYADYGKLTQLGLRGPLGGLEGLGWDVALRHDTYMLSQTGVQLMVPFARLDAVGWGGDFRLNGKADVAGMRLYYAPLLSVMSNRWGVGLEAGLEYDLAGFILGANAGARYHFGLKDAPQYSYLMQAFEDQLGLGVRKALTDSLEANLSFQWQPDNVYGIWNRSYTAGVAYRPAKKSAEPLPEPASAPTPEPTPTPLEAPAEGEYQVFFKDESGNPDLVDFAVTDAVTSDLEGAYPVVSLDVAWPGLVPAVYQGLVRGSLAGESVTSRASRSRRRR